MPTDQVRNSHVQDSMHACTSVSKPLWLSSRTLLRNKNAQAQAGTEMQPLQTAHSVAAYTRQQTPEQTTNTAGTATARAGGYTIPLNTRHVTVTTTWSYCRHGCAALHLEDRAAAQNAPVSDAHWLAPACHLAL